MNLFIALVGFFVFQILMIIMCVITNSHLWMWVSISVDILGMIIFFTGLALNWWNE